MCLIAANTSLDVVTIVMQLAGGLAIFLFGMDQMTGALKIVAGERMKSVLARLTRNRFKAAAAGAFVTAVIQSSSVTTVLLVGFISAGLLTLTQSIGVIMGANVGTTVTAQIIAFKVTHYALVLVVVGFVALFVSPNERVKQYGHMLMGLGLVFFGMQLMSDGTSPLREYDPFINLMRSMDNPVMAVVLSALFTGIIQSSSATTGVIIVLASQGFITLDAGIALVFGANVGTCITAILASIRKPREAVRAAAVHVLFNILGVVVWFAFIGHLAALVRLISPSAPELDGVARLAAETPRQIANAHTIFNIANTLIFIGFTTPMARLVYRIVPDRPAQKPEVMRPRYLDAVLLRTPALALDIVRMELGRLGAAALHIVRESPGPVLHGSRQQLDQLQAMDADVDAMHGAIVTYLGRLSQEHLSDRQSEVLHDYLGAANYLENIGDMIETNLVEAGRERLAHDVRISDATVAVLSRLHERVAESVEQALTALVESDQQRASSVLTAKDEINRLAEEAERHLADRLVASEPNRMATFRVEADLIENLKRIYYFAKRIAKLVSETDMRYLKPGENAETGDQKSGGEDAV